MQNQTIMVKDKKQSIQLKVRRMSIYKQSKIIEATDVQEQTYYIFFYHERYLTYAIPKESSKHSHVINSFKQGITLYAPHPLIASVVSPYPQFKKQSYSDLFKKIQYEYDPQETALIASYFESFISKEKIADYIQTLFFKERRDGKLLSCYRIFSILKDFHPNHSLIDTFSRDMEFDKYEALYKQEDKTILSKDPIYVEEKLYSSKHDSFQKLAALYLEQNRWIDLAAIYIKHVVNTQKTDDYDKLKSLIEEHFNDINGGEILEDLYARGLTIHPLQQDLLNSYMEHEKLDEMLNLISKHKLTLQVSQSQALTKLVKEKGITPGSIQPKGLQKLFLTFVAANDRQAVDILHQAVSSLLNDHTLSYLEEWAQSFRGITLAVPILQMIDEMNQIVEDPNQQGRLGELYHYFHQPKLAIECMSWDMELRNDDPKPVEWLAKLYRELGMDAEHKAYQQLYIDMVKRSS